MPKEEEYLENLLDSISKAREDVDATYRKDSEEAEKKAQKRAEIGPDDSFMEKAGLSGAAPKSSSRKNLKKALSEDDFLSEFESMLDDSAPASDIDDIDTSSAYDTDDDKGDGLPDGEDVSPYFSKIGEPEQKKEDSPKDDLMDDISSIVSNAKEKAGESILSKDKKDSQKEDKKSIVDSDDEEPILDDIDLDKVDMSDTSAKDVSLMDESGDGSDLSDMLSGDDDLSDIGDLLDADENGTELPESRDSFEESADSVAEESKEADSDNASAKASDGSKKKGGFLSGLIAKIRSVFSKDEDDDKLSTDELLSDHSDSPEELADENEEIMKNFSDEATKAEPEKKEKKEKKPAKEKKEKKPKEPKQPKPKKPKPVDNSPLIPGKVIGIFLFLAISIFALAYIGVTILPKNQQKQTAEDQYTQQDYLDAYLYYASLAKPDKDETKKLTSSRYAASITLKYNSYENAMSRHAYDYALDALLRGYTEYTKNKDKVTKLDINKYYNDYGTRIIDALHDQFGLSESDAAGIASEKSRSGYTKRIDEVLAEKGLSVSA